jgi:outer membrane phospholipase A
MGISLGFAPALYAQWFEGYGESLLAYDEYRRSFRIGFSLEDRFADPRLPSF